MESICKFIAKWMGVVVLVCAIGSYLLPGVIPKSSTAYINPLLGLVMFGMGLTLELNDFKQQSTLQLTRWPQFQAQFSVYGIT